MTPRKQVLAIIRLLGRPGIVPEEIDDRLCVCARCGADAVALVDWAEQGKATWRLWLRCGECGTIRDVLADKDHVTQLAYDLEYHALTIAEALAEFQRRCLQHDLLVLRQALELDLIDASDFAP